MAFDGGEQMTIPVIALPGGVMPAELRYTSLASRLDGEVAFRYKDLEVYASERPPASYSIELEVDAVERFADSLGLDRFHLLGYSGGGFVSLAFAGMHPDRLLSLAVFEPAAVPGTLTQEEDTFYSGLRAALAGLSGADFMRSFMQLQVRPGVVLTPPAGPPPPWMGNRPAGLATLIAAFDSYSFDRDRLRRCDVPVFFGYGDLTG
jgi:pimeloyl-ACP methyl ester carboxylesterase